MDYVLAALTFGITFCLGDLLFLLFFSRTWLQYAEV